MINLKIKIISHGRVYARIKMHVCDIFVFGIIVRTYHYDIIYVIRNMYHIIIISYS